MMKFVKLGIISMISIFALAACLKDVEPACIQENGEPCEPPPIPVYPSLVKVDTLNYLVDDIFVKPGEEFHILLRGAMGDSLLETLEILENGEYLALDRMTINGVQLQSNPHVFSRNDPDKFTWDVGLIAQTSLDKVQYEFILEDESSRQAITDIIVNTQINEFTPPTIKLLLDTVPTVIGQGVGNFDFEVDAIGSPIESIAIFQASALVDSLSRLKFGGETFTSNPLPLTDPDRYGFSKTIAISSTDNSGLEGYTVVFQDSLGTEYTHEVGIQIIKLVETSFDIQLSNSDLGNKLGALDLDATFPMESGIEGNLDAEIKDNGTINGTWSQKITAYNSAEMGSVNFPADSTDYYFNLIETDNQIKDLWEDAAKFPLTSLMNEPAEYTSGIVNEGDVFIVRRISDYFIFRIVEVNTTSGNEFYSFDLKR